MSTKKLRNRSQLILRQVLVGLNVSLHRLCSLSPPLCCSLRREPSLEPPGLESDFRVSQSPPSTCESHLELLLNRQPKKIKLKKLFKAIADAS